MDRFVRHFSWFVTLLASLAFLIPDRPAQAEVHYFCTILAGQTCGKLRARNTALLGKISRYAGQDAVALEAIKQVRGKVSAESVTGPDLVKLAHAMRTAAPPAAQAEIKNALGEIAVNQQVKLWLDKGTPGNVKVPAGANVPIALVPGMPRGQIVSIGFGPVLIGVGQAGSSIVLGQGNVQQTADEVSRPGNGNPSAAVTLANPTDTPVSYTVNQQAFKMEPKFTQDLNGGGSSLVAFDRGNNLGTAQYRLESGYYEFAVTSQGWELYKKQRPSKSDAAAASQTAESSTYPQSIDMQLPKNFKLFDPVPTIAGDAQSPPAARLPEHFTLFRAAAAENVAEAPRE